LCSGSRGGGKPIAGTRTCSRRAAADTRHIGEVDRAGSVRVMGIARYERATGREAGTVSRLGRIWISYSPRIRPPRLPDRLLRRRYRVAPGCECFREASVRLDRHLPLTPWLRQHGRMALGGPAAGLRRRRPRRRRRQAHGGVCSKARHRRIGAARHPPRSTSKSPESARRPGRRGSQ